MTPSPHQDLFCGGGGNKSNTKILGSNQKCELEPLCQVSRIALAHNVLSHDRGKNLKEIISQIKVTLIPCFPRKIPYARLTIALQLTNLFVLYMSKRSFIVYSLDKTSWTYSRRLSFNRWRTLYPAVGMVLIIDGNLKYRCARKGQSLSFDVFKAFDKCESSHKSVFFYDFFS